MMSIYKNFRTYISSALSLSQKPSTGFVQPAPPKGQKDRLRYRIRKLYKYRVNTDLDGLRSAVQGAENYQHPDRRQLYGIYYETMEDLHLTAVISNRIESTLQETFVIRDQKSQTIDESLKDLFEKPWFYDFCRYAIESVFWGHSLMEFGALMEGEHTQLELIPREFVRPEWGMILLDQGQLTGPLYREAKEYKWMIEIGDKYDLGLLRKLAKAVIIKNYSLTDWARHAEKYGDPFVTLKTSTRDETALAQKEQMLSNFGRNGYAILDDMDDVHLIESMKANPHMLYDKLADRMDNYITKSVLGQTMTTEDGSSLSQAEVHERVLDKKILSDMRFLQFQINMRLLPKLIEHGYPLQGKEFSFYRFTKEYKEEIEEKKNLMGP